MNSRFLLRDVSDLISGVVFFQADKMKEERKVALEGLVDKIVEGRRRKQLGLDTKKKKRKKVKSEDNNEEKASENEDTNKEKILELLKPIEDSERQAVLEEELAKIPPLSKENTLIQTFTSKTSTGIIIIIHIVAKIPCENLSLCLLQHILGCEQRMLVLLTGHFLVLMKRK